uniref:Uncharacterized protein n=1 Tax=Arundo donax TaxID=35708 RepID=A0A0A9GA60_ARUDO
MKGNLTREFLEPEPYNQQVGPATKYSRGRKPMHKSKSSKILSSSVPSEVEMKQLFADTCQWQQIRSFQRCCWTNASTKSEIETKLHLFHKLRHT